MRKAARLLLVVGVALVVLAFLSVDLIPELIVAHERRAGLDVDSSEIEARWLERGWRAGIGGTVLLCVGGLLRVRRRRHANTDLSSK